MKNVRQIKQVSAVILSLALSMGGSLPASAAKLGGSCSKLKSTTILGSKVLKCTKKGSKKVWVSAGTAYGTSRAPAPIGKAVKIEAANYTLTSVQEGIDSWICEENSFNDGCTWNDDFDIVVDPSSTKRWIRFNLDVTNPGSKIIEPYFGDVGVVVNGKISWQGWMQPSVTGGISDLTILGGSSDSGAVYVQIAKSAQPTQLVLRPNLFESKFYFFKLN